MKWRRYLAALAVGTIIFGIGDLSAEHWETPELFFYSGWFACGAYLLITKQWSL
jgi:hypothetical protein